MGLGAAAVPGSSVPSSSPRRAWAPAAAARRLLAVAHRPVGAGFRVGLGARSGLGTGARSRHRMGLAAAATSAPAVRAGALGPRPGATSTNRRKNTSS